MRQKLTVIVAVVICFAGLMAVTGDLFGLSHPGVWNETAPDTLAVADSVAVADTLSTPVSPVEEALLNPKRLPPLPPDHIDTETLWLARGIFSETKRPEEQELVAWVIRNRVETGYRGKRTYRDVVLDPYQFSAFAPGNPMRDFYIGLDVNSRVPGWRRALQIANFVRTAGDSLRPFSERTRHFFSERSLSSGAHPKWALGREPVQPRRKYQIDARRFRFYEGVS
jgi:hypothetical protein